MQPNFADAATVDLGPKQSGWLTNQLGYPSLHIVMVVPGWVCPRRACREPHPCGAAAPTRRLWSLCRDHCIVWSMHWHERPGSRRPRFPARPVHLAGNYHYGHQHVDHVETIVLFGQHTSDPDAGIQNSLHALPGHTLQQQGTTIMHTMMNDNVSVKLAFI